MLPLPVLVIAVNGAPHLLGGGLVIAGQPLLAALIAPLPALATTALYDEL